MNIYTYICWYSYASLQFKRVKRNWTVHTFVIDKTSCYLQPHINRIKWYQVLDTNSHSNEKVFIYWNVLSDFLPRQLFYYLYISRVLCLMCMSKWWLFCGFLCFCFAFWWQWFHRNVWNLFWDNCTRAWTIMKEHPMTPMSPTTQQQLHARLSPLFNDHVKHLQVTNKVASLLADCYI